MKHTKGLLAASVLCISFLLGACTQKLAGIRKAPAFLTAQARPADVHRPQGILSNNTAPADSASLKSNSVQPLSGKLSAVKIPTHKTRLPFHIKTDEANRMLHTASAVLLTPMPADLFHKSTAQTKNSINKAGLILIGAAIIAYFVKVPLLAVIIVFVLGLIILLAPLFRRRY